MILPTEFKIFTIERGITFVSLPRSRISRKTLGVCAEAESVGYH